MCKYHSVWRDYLQYCLLLNSSALKLRKDFLFYIAFCSQPSRHTLQLASLAGTQIGGMFLKQQQNSLAFSVSLGFINDKKCCCLSTTAKLNFWVFFTHTSDIARKMVAMQLLSSLSAFNLLLVVDAPLCVGTACPLRARLGRDTSCLPVFPLSRQGAGLVSRE